MMSASAGPTAPPSGRRCFSPLSSFRTRVSAAPRKWMISTSGNNRRAEASRRTALVPILKPLPRDWRNASSVTPLRRTSASLGGSRESVAPITRPGVSSLPGMSFSECIAAWSSPDSTAARICATKAPPLPPWGSSLLVWSRSPVVSNLTISTSRSGMAAVRRRAISSVCASAIALLRVPILNRVAKPKSSQDASLPRILQYHVGGLFGDHDDRRVGVPRHEIGHDRAVDDSEAFEAPHLQPLIDHRERIIAHTTGRGWMVDGAAPLTAIVQQLGIRGHLRSGIVLVDHERLQRRCMQYLAQDLQAFHVGGAVGLGRHVVDADLRRHCRVSALDAQGPAAFGTELAHRRREAGETMKLLAHLVGRERQEMDLDVRRGQPRTGLKERARRAGRDRQPAFAEQRIARAGHRAAERMIDGVVQRDLLRAAHHDADLHVVLEIVPDARRVQHDIDAVLAQEVAGPDAGEQEQLRRVVGAARQHALLAHTDAAQCGALTIFNADRAAALEQHALAERASF